jgi:hypothetical protein
MSHLKDSKYNWSNFNKLLNIIRTKLSTFRQEPKLDTDNWSQNDA